MAFHGLPLARFAYVRCGWVGMIESTLGLLTRKLYVRDVSRPNAETVAVLKLSWA